MTTADLAMVSLPAGPALDAAIDDAAIESYVRESEAALLRSTQKFVDKAPPGKYYAQAATVRSHIKRTAELPCPTNKYLTWLVTNTLAARPKVKPWSACGMATELLNVCQDLKKPITEAAAEVRFHLQSRELAAGQRPEEFNGLTNPKTNKGYRRSERPREETYVHRQRLKRSFEILEAAGWKVPLVVEVPGRGRGGPTNRLRMLHDMEPFKAHMTPDDRAFLYLHVVIPDIQSIRNVRFSWIQPVLGEWAIVTPWGAVCYLGPYAADIIGLALRRRTKDNPDPILLVHKRREGKDKWRLVPLDDVTHPKRVKRLLGKQASAMLLVQTGRLALLAAGFSAYYVLQASHLDSTQSLEEIEHNRLCLHLAQAKDAVQFELMPNLHPAPLGKKACTCGHVDDLGCVQCPTCLRIYPATTAEATPLHVATRIIHDLLNLRGATPRERETEYHDRLQALLETT